MKYLPILIADTIIKVVDNVPTPSKYIRKKAITEDDIVSLHSRGITEIMIMKNEILTPLASERIKDLSIRVKQKS